VRGAVPPVSLLGMNIMPAYQFKHVKTGEIIDMFLRLSELDTWKENNPEYQSYHGSAPSLVSGVKSARQIAGREWEDHLSRIKKGSGRNNNIKV